MLIILNKHSVLTTHHLYMDILSSKKKPFLGICTNLSVGKCLITLTLQRESPNSHLLVSRVQLSLISSHHVHISADVPENEL